MQVNSKLNSKPYDYLHEILEILIVVLKVTNKFTLFEKSFKSILITVKHAVFTRVSAAALI